MPAIIIFTPVSCLSGKNALEEAPIITSATYQHTQFNGRSQPVEVSAAKDDVPLFIVTYFRSEGDLEAGRGGSAEAPSEVGDYYARIERPGGNGYKPGKNIKIEYHIQKAFISFIADPVQRFAYDGTPKEAAARTEPPVELSAAYFDAAGFSGQALASPPVERGRYRVVLVFPGSERYMGASKEIDLRIE
ncbi:MAG: hypothetical protein LBK05_05810 [Treponema sp.]|nr:hypothetical protein [Treponema sp.]